MGHLCPTPAVKFKKNSLMGVIEGRVQNNEVLVYQLQISFCVHKAHVAVIFYQTDRTNDSATRTTQTDTPTET